MNIITDAEQLRKIALFAQLDAGRLKRLAFASEESSFDDGDIIFINKHNITKKYSRSTYCFYISSHV